MKLPLRFSLQTLFVLIALLSIPLGWVAYQLNWIRQRHAFLAAHNDADRASMQMAPLAQTPFPLSIFGQAAQHSMVVMPEYISEAKRLFPEATVFDGSRQLELMY